MRVSKVTREGLITALAITNLEYEGNLCFDDYWKALNKKGTRFQIRLRTHSARKNRKGERPPGCVIRPAGFGRKHERGVATACWHSMRDFLRALFEIHPEAVVRTAIATYEGKEGFEENYRGTASRNIGSRMEPLYYSEACDCGGGPL
jgi:hypothetical protein